MLKNECPNCGGPVPANARGGHCPRCLLRRGLDSDPDQTSEHDTVDLAARPGLVLETIGATIGRVPRVLLRDTALGEEPSPILQPMCDDETSTRYRIDGEIARGGMGQVLKGRDPDLGRDVAIKVLREDFRDDADMVRRFVEEAQIGGQLQHPGIVPIYELGIFGDGRPYFSMKLIKGDTLAKLLEARDGPDDGLPRFLAIFEAVAQTVAYAHARGVIHRDLKPSNVMVGAFGEVQVMDWGLAKVLPRGGVADDAAAGKIHREETVISTARSGAEGSELSRAGSAMGTPSYMAPEQARGEVERIDERVDVFALGSVLCEILTSQPAFRGRNSGEIQRMAARGDTADALTRLDRGGIDPELVDLARDCLARESADRPRDAGAVSRRLTGYLTSVQERLRLTELARVASSARAEEAVRTAEVAEARAAAERRARRMQLGLAGAVLALTILGGLGATAWLQQRSARLGRIDVALKEAELLFDQAAAETAGVSGKWQKARLALKRSADLLAETNAADAMARVAELEHRIDAGEEQAHFDEALIGRLEAVRFRREHRLAEAGEPGKRADAQTETDYAALFREAELDPDRLDAADWKRHLAGRPAKLVVAIVAALDDWATVRRRTAGDQAILGTKRLIDAVGAIDPDPWRNDLRKAISARDKETLVRLANDPKLTDQPPPSLILLAIELTAAKQENLAIDTLRRAQRRYPDNFPINDLLSWMLDAKTLWGYDRAGIPEAVRFATVAVALNPGAGMPRATLAMLLSYAGQNEEAEWEFREAIRLQPDYPNVYTHYALMLQYAGRFEEARVQLRAALRLKPDWADARSFLGRILNALGRYDEAVSELRETIRIKPDLAQPHDYLAVALARQGKFEEAFGEWRQAVRLDPYYTDTYDRIFLETRQQGKLEEAIAECRQWIRENPNVLEPRERLVDFFRSLGRNDDAAAEIREAIRLLPDSPWPHTWLGSLELWNGNEQAAIAASRKALDIEPGIVDAHRCIGLALLSLGRRGEADAAFRKAQKLAPAHAEIPGDLRMVALAPRLPAVLRGEDRPANPAERIDFANLAYRGRRFAAAARLYTEALEEDPALADDCKAHHARQAAVYAALAGCVEGRDDPPPTADERIALRRQSLKLLHADLDAWARIPERDPKESKNVIAAMRAIREDYVLADVREADALAKLPEPERKDWRSLWADVEALVRRARERKP